MKGLLLAVLFIIVSVLSAAMHEKDMSRNFNETRDAKAWFYDIKIEKSPAP